MVVSIQVIVGHREGEVTGMADSLVMCLKSSWIVLWCLNGDIISPQELAVGKGDSTRSINLYYILVKLVDLNDDACLVALVGMWTCLILNLYIGGLLQEVVISWCVLSTTQLLSCTSS